MSVWRVNAVIFLPDEFLSLPDLHAKHIPDQLAGLLDFRNCGVRRRLVCHYAGLRSTGALHEWRGVGKDSLSKFRVPNRRFADAG